jgi:predicted nucleic acid-binding protein
MATMGDKFFVDTNILLRAVLSQMHQHGEVDTLLKDTIREGAELWISGQIIREFIVQATHPRTLAQPLSIEDVVQEIEAIKPLFQIADETAVVRAQLLEILQQYPTIGKQVHDANLIATMLAYGIDTLITLKTADFKRFDDKVKIISLKEET